MKNPFLNDAQKALKARKWLEGFAQSQPARNEIWVWSTEASHFPPVALAMLYDAVKKGI